MTLTYELNVSQIVISNFLNILLYFNIFRLYFNQGNIIFDSCKQFSESNYFNFKPFFRYKSNFKISYKNLSEIELILQTSNIWRLSIVMIYREYFKERKYIFNVQPQIMIKGKASLKNLIRKQGIHQPFQNVSYIVNQSSQNAFNDISFHFTFHFTEYSV
ncbi:unnamed protein product (macronuclear) [Paramecium tetraurelia]|uniref:Transmembrane protein n=1 Tax=Paramecium tetraurelia TaxID=5888 RepID=A0DBR9_PARTE|nr:uncharacterized protein GSPATT00015383001 [Paramecium tetraurelia]CAK80486.1 unnamed protein product [Paramecium tetraurelia]|eukprot:XP_001447883.1 hypothetical protein (macronuclear) [Paramecium tetraurelia strain d4-2]